MHVNVLVIGRLAGMGHQADCEVMVKRVGPGGAAPGAYTDPVIIHVEQDLPEGEYTLFCENLSVPVVHKGVLWIVSAPPPEGADEPLPESGGKAKPAGGAVAMARRMIRDRRKKK